MDIKEYFGFQFTKIGFAVLSDIKTDVKYRGEMIKDWDVVIEFLYPGCELAGQSTYLVFVDDQLKYAGEYSGTFQERWILPRNGVWYIAHSDNDFRIQDLLRSDEPPEISIWLCSDPFIVASDGERWNNNLALERRIITELQPEWNKRGRAKPTIGKLLTEILESQDGTRTDESDRN